MMSTESVILIIFLIVLFSVGTLSLTGVRIIDVYQESQQGYSQVERMKAMLIYCQRICDSEIYFVEWNEEGLVDPPSYGDCLGNCLQFDPLKDWFKIEAN